MANAATETRQPSARRGSLLRSPFFFPAIVFLLFTGHACDIYGTYSAQPKFEAEGNYLYRWLAAHGHTPGWRDVIFAKIGICLAVTMALYLFLKRLRAHYPPAGANFRVFVTTYFHGRPLTWLQTLRIAPREIWPTVLFIGSVIALSGPWGYYFCYENFAYKHNWWSAPQFHLGSFWVDSSIPVGGVSIIAFLLWQMWRDYRTQPENRAGEALSAGLEERAMP